VALGSSSVSELPWMISSRFLVAGDRRVVVTGDDEQRGGANVVERRSCELRPAGARDDGAEEMRTQRRRGQRSAPGDVRAEHPEGQARGFGLRRHPVGGGHHPLGHRDQDRVRRRVG
jgi:hypothetical protein